MSELAETIRIVTRIVNDMSLLKEQQKTLSFSPSLGISALEIYNLSIEVIQDLIFIVSRKHYRAPRNNDQFLMLKGVVDELGNSDKIVKIPDRRKLTDPDSTEVQALWNIIQDLESLRRNRSLTRASSRRRSFETSHDKKVPKKIKGKRRRIRKKRGMLVKGSKC